MSHILFGWATKGHCDVTMLDSFMACIWIFVVLGIGCAVVAFSGRKR